MKYSALFAAFLATCVVAAKPSTVTVTTTVTKKPHSVIKTTVTRTGVTKTTDTVTHTKQVTDTATVTSVVTSTETDTITNTETDTVTSTETDTTTLTVTTTTSPSPTFTDFSGSGNLIVYAGGSKQGHISHSGGWYTSSTPATFQGAPQNSDNSNFTLTSSQGPCQVLSGGAFNCTSGNMATVFGQTNDGNLTYLGSDVFGAQAGPATNSPGTEIDDVAEQFTLNIQWFSTN